jgi:hypothetical protein
MRTTQWLGGLFGLLALAWPAQAQPAASPATVSAADVAVRSGPNEKFYATCRLKQGQTVEVVPLPPEKQQPGWLAIKPPQGSFSWISARFVKKLNDQGGVVLGDVPVSVLMGSQETNDPPTVKAAEVKPGTQVAILGKAEYTDGIWLPIQPTLDEVRYIPASAVNLPGAAAAVVARSQAGAATPPGGQPQAPPAAGASTLALIAQAEQAQRAGRIEDAKALYRQAADKETDYQTRILCLNRLENLKNSGAGTTALPGHPNGGIVSHNVDGDSHLLVSSSGGTGNTTAHYPAANAAGPATPVGPQQWSSWGVLHRANFQLDGQNLYRLENAKGEVLLYAVPRPGFSLEEYVGRTLSLYGPISYRGDDSRRVHFITAIHVAFPPATPAATKGWRG